ncbi:MAG: hypothetical protein DYH08_00210 [Actinobacteria bacterium ATB1]|nr:hypothetical protein [Actinobacteria bacterium ATB1]
MTTNLTPDGWDEGRECEAHEMAWCAYCNPNESSMRRTDAAKVKAEPKAPPRAATKGRSAGTKKKAART